MAIVVVDVLEIIQIDEGHREAVAVAAAMQQVVDVQLDRRAVWKAGHCVQVGKALEFPLDRLALRDVDRSREHDRFVVDTNRPL